MGETVDIFRRLSLELVLWDDTLSLEKADSDYYIILWVKSASVVCLNVTFRNQPVYIH